MDRATMHNRRAQWAQPWARRVFTCEAAMIEDVMELVGGPLDGGLVDVDNPTKMSGPLRVGCKRDRYQMDGVPKEFNRVIKPGETPDAVYSYRLVGKKLVYAGAP